MGDSRQQGLRGKLQVPCLGSACLREALLLDSGEEKVQVVT